MKALTVVIFSVINLYDVKMCSLIHSYRILGESLYDVTMCSLIHSYRILGESL